MGQAIVRVPDMLKAPEDAQDPQPRYAVWESVSEEFISWDLTAEEVREDMVADAIDRANREFAEAMTKVELYGTNGRTVAHYNPLEYRVMDRDEQHGTLLNENATPPERAQSYGEFLARVREHFELPQPQLAYESARKLRGE